ncbi:Transcription initiation factor IIA subunit 2 [Atta colombica]|uniref:Transcription initiation factor IIA subunit 2 n=1 Tax=Atta colombica TaxID=520822 RepID=A0A195BCS6_9HYME|nr:Transcription initiation factor IIA subunit 2 [Atta colombica]
MRSFLRVKVRACRARTRHDSIAFNVVGRDVLRNTTLGNTLQESLDELIQYGQITPQLAIKVLLQFDKAINQALATRVKSRLTFKAGKLNTYRFCDNVWTFMLNDVEFREVQEVAIVDKVKIVACDGKTLDADGAAKR